MTKIVVAGCSFSDYLPKTDKVYGEILANNLSLQYKHEGAGAGSNWRIWRRITGLVQQHIITPEDILLIQYTGLERKEFWVDSPPQPCDNKINARELYDNGAIIRYKAFSPTWHVIPHEYQFLDLYERYFVNIKFSREQFETQHFMFQHMLKNMNIKTVFMHTRHTADGYINLIDHFQKSKFREDLNWCSEPWAQYSDVDNAHLSNLGHSRLAKDLEAHLRGLGWI